MNAVMVSRGDSRRHGGEHCDSVWLDFTARGLGARWVQYLMRAAAIHRRSLAWKLGNLAVSMQQSRDLRRRLHAARWTIMLTGSRTIMPTPAH